MALRPWREVITPHSDVASGRYSQAKFRADLAEVVQGTAEPEYGDPSEFYARTYLTEGMRRLLVAAVHRLSGTGGEPVVQVKTAFGGGKTHTMIAPYHLFGGTPVERMASAPRVLSDAGVGSLPTVDRAVAVGTAPNATMPRQVGTVTVRTLWGDIAAQLGGPDAYALVEQADRKGISPGSDVLTQLLECFGPAVILIDELVSYVRNFCRVRGLPAGSFDSNLSFIQALTEAVARSRRGMLVASLPESDIEIGGEGGRAAQARLEHIFARVQAIWQPVGPIESFEIVRRRLFTTIRDQTARDEACRAFMGLYDAEPSDFPPDCRQGAYLDRLRGAYPIHPELFDRLYEDWSSLERFQRTRGVLRLMAAVIHHLWTRGDQSLLIMPGSVPLDAPRVQSELLRYLPEGWNAVIDRDVDGERSQPRAVDEQSPRFGACSAARRVARTILLGSAAHVREMRVRGIEDVRVRLGVVQPGESVAVFNDALGRLTERLTYLYSGNRRYWYDTRPNLRRTMEERAGRLDPADIEAEIVRRLRQIRERGDFKGVHVCPSSGDVPDERTARLVVLSPSAGHRPRRVDSLALSTAREILDNRGDSPRKYRNMLLFVATDANENGSLDEATRRYLAWRSIVEDSDTLNLDAHQRREAARGGQRSEETLNARLNDAYCWLLVPTQEGTEPVDWEETRIAGAQENPVAKAVRKVRSAEQLIARWSPALLRMELDRWLWKDVPHVGLGKVWNCLTTYLYLPRLRDEDVLLDAVRQGLRTRDYFGYATSVSKEGRYEGLQFGSATGSIYLDEASVLVKPEVAAWQLQVEATRTATITPAEAASGQGLVSSGQDTALGTTVAGTRTGVATVPKRFYGRIQLDPVRMSTDAGKVHQEVIQHLAALLGADVEISLEIRAIIPGGAPDHVVRTVTENSRTLGFASFEFEEE